MSAGHRSSFLSCGDGPGEGDVPYARDNLIYAASLRWKFASSFRLIDETPLAYRLQVTRSGEFLIPEVTCSPGKGVLWRKSIADSYQKAAMAALRKADLRQVLAVCRPRQRIHDDASAGGMNRERSRLLSHPDSDNMEASGSGIHPSFDGSPRGVMSSILLLKMFPFVEAEFTAFLVAVLIATGPYFRSQTFFCRWMWAWPAHAASLAVGAPPAQVALKAMPPVPRWRCPCCAPTHQLSAGLCLQRCS
jgi:hypothetical protein